MMCSHEIDHYLLEYYSTMLKPCMPAMNLRGPPIFNNS